MGFKYSNIEADNKVAIQSIQGEIEVSWLIQHTILDIKIFIQHWKKIYFHDIVWERYMEVDWLAKLVCASHCISFSTSFACDDSLLILIDDNVSRTVKRMVH